MSQNHHQPRAEARRRELDAADLGRGDDVAGDADDEQVAQPLVEDDLRRHPRVGTAEQDRERLLPGRELVAPRRAGGRGVGANVGDEARVPLPQPVECLQRSHHPVESVTGSA